MGDFDVKWQNNPFLRYSIKSAKKESFHAIFGSDNLTIRFTFTTNAVK